MRTLTPSAPRRRFKQPFHFVVALDQENRATTACGRYAGVHTTLRLQTYPDRVTCQLCRRTETFRVQHTAQWLLAEKQ